MKLKETLLKNLRPLTYREVEKLREMGFGRKDLGTEDAERVLAEAMNAVFDDAWRDLPYGDTFDLYEEVIRLTFPEPRDLKNSKRSGSGTKARVRNTAGPAARRKKT